MDRWRCVEQMHGELRQGAKRQNNPPMMWMYSDVRQTELSPV